MVRSPMREPAERRQPTERLVVAPIRRVHQATIATHLFDQLVVDRRWRDARTQCCARRGENAK
jgi:hypothetical protein